MLENEIQQKTNNDRFQNSKYIVDQSNIERLSFGNKNNNFKTNTYIPHYENQTLSQKFSNPVTPQNYYTINDNYNKKQIYNNYKPYITNNNNNYNEFDSFYNYNNNSISNNINGYDGRSYNTGTISIVNQSPINMNERSNYMNFSKDMTPKYYKKKNNNVIYNNSSHIGNRYSTDGGESYLNYNRDSNFNTQNHYQGISIIYPREDKLNTCESNDEQLIIYPEEKNKFENEKYFDSSTSEGILKPKNLEVYAVNSIEYVPEERDRYRGFSLGDYILKKENKYKIRKTKSCSCLNSSRDREINEYKIKVFKNKKNKERKNVSCDEYSTRRIKNKMNFNKLNKEIPKGHDEKKILRLLEHFKNEKLYDDNIKPETNIEKGGIVYFKKNSFSRKYNSNYIINKNNFKLIQYPKWKIVSSTCLIQSWWRSLKSLYNDYLQKIIIIQKVFRTHYYRIRYLSSMSLEEEKKYQNYLQQEYGQRRNNIYGQKGQKQNINYKKYPPNGGEIILSKDLKEYNMNKEVNKSNKYAIKYHMNKYISRNNNNLRKEYSSIKKFSNSLNFSCYNYNFNRFNIGILLLKKIIENYLLKNYQNFILKFSNKIKGKGKEIKEDKTDTKSNYKYLSSLINNIFKHILKTKKAIFYNKLFNSCKNKNVLLNNEGKNNNNNNNNELTKITYQKNKKRIININEENIREINVYERKTNNNFIDNNNKDDNIKNIKNNFDSNEISIINNSSFSFIKNIKAKDNNISNDKKTDNKITNENNINKNEKLNKFNSDKLLINNNFSISFIGFDVDKKNCTNENKNIMTNNKIENNNEIISSNMNIKNIPLFHTFNLKNISICNIISFSYIRISDNLLRNNKNEESNNKIKTKINEYSEESIIINKNIDDNNIKINEFNMEEDYTHRNDKNNIQMNYNKSNTQEKSTNTDINNNYNMNIISQPKRLSKTKKNKNEKIERNNRDNKDNNNINNSSPENNKLNFINHTTYSKDSITIVVEKNKEPCYIILNEKYKNLFYPIRNDLISIQDLLLKFIFLRLWKNQAFLIKNAKRAHKKDKKIESKTISKSNSSDNSNKKITSESQKGEIIHHILLLNLMKYVMEKIRKEIKRRKLIICFKDINTLKYPNLKFAFKKIKKFAKVRFKVMNEYASLIQNAFRYYLENKNKENEQDEINNNNQYDNEKK